MENGPAIGKTTAKVIQPAVDTAAGSNKPTTGTSKEMLERLPTNHPIDVTKI